METKQQPDLYNNLQEATGGQVQKEHKEDGWGWGKVKAKSASGCMQ